jgi:prolyl-tRNA synthetase
MRLSSVPYSQNITFNNLSSSLSCNQILSDTKLIQQSAAGHIIYTPILQRIKRNIENIALSYSESYGFNEMLFPVLMDSKLLDISGKTAEYANEFYDISDKNGNLIISPTTEERLIDFVSHNGTLSYKNLPMRFSQVSNVYRNLKRPEGLYKSREISCVVLTAIDAEHSQYLETMNDFRLLCEKTFANIGIPNFYIQDKVSGAIEFFYETELADRPLDKSIINNFGNKNVFDTQKHYGSLSMGYPFYQSEKFNLFYTDKDGIRKQPIVSTYGIGTQRCILVMFEYAKNGKTDAFKQKVRPFDVDIVVLAKDKYNSHIQTLADKLRQNGIQYCIDDRNNNMRDKMRFSEFFSVPCRVIIGDKEIQQNLYAIKPLDDNEVITANFDSALNIAQQLTKEKVR